MLASIQEIEKIYPIEGAEKIELAVILGWQLVVQKGEFQPGDKCIYIEIDSLIPRRSWSTFLFEEGDDSQYHRLRTVKRMKQVSQGLAIPLLEGMKSLHAGEDVTDLLGVKKYEKPTPSEPSAQTGRKSSGKSFPSFIRKTDEVNVQSAPRLVDLLNGRAYYITLKMDGTSFTFFKLKGNFRACSRNNELKDPMYMSFLEKLKYKFNRIFRKWPEHIPSRDIYWRMVDKYSLRHRTREGMCYQGEICGPTIQSNRMGLSENELFIFNVYDLTEKKYRNLLLEEWLPVQPVPVIAAGGSFDMTMEQLLDLADQQLYDNNELAEGIVVRDMDGKISFKVVSRRYLLKNKE